MTSMASAGVPLADVSLDDKYALEQGRVFLTGIQALVRLPMLQRQRDQAAGLNTGGYISGYRGSPLGGLDQQLWHAKPFIETNHIRFEPGVNEDLALRVYTSRLLGRDPLLVMHGGGNTSVKTSMADLLGEHVQVLCWFYSERTGQALPEALLLSAQEVRAQGRVLLIHRSLQVSYSVSAGGVDCLKTFLEECFGKFVEFFCGES